jgi:hypothetical protein
VHGPFNLEDGTQKKKVFILNGGYISIGDFFGY